MISLLKYAKKYKKEVLLGPLFKFMEAVFELFLPIYMARLVDNGIAKNDQPYVVKTALTMLLMTVIGLVCVLICQYFSSYASQGFGTELRKELMKKINTFSHAELNHFGTSTLITRMTSDVNQLQFALAMLIRLVIRAPFLSVGSLIMAFYIQPKLALIFTLALPFFCLILWWISRKTVPLYKKVQKKVDQLNKVVQENLKGVRVIRAFAQKNSSIRTMTETTEQLEKSYTRVANISALLNPATTFIMNLSIIALLYFGGIQVNIGDMKQGEVLALINYMIQMLLALIVVSNLVVIFTRASASASRVNELLNTLPSIEEPVTPITVNDEKIGCLSVENISFRYSPESGLALKNIDFSLQQNRFLGIVGPTGSGKSTLIQLILRFYDVTEGTISLNGIAIKNISLHDLRNQISISPQTSVLFSGTIKENLQWGKHDATEEECWQALKTAQCLDFVKELPLQLETLVMEGGKNFSGGQRQRLTIARALIKKPKILLLDDSLSALDYQTDLQLREALKTDLTETSLIVVSQRISSVENADHILVLNEGKQVGFGSHKELLGTSTVYQELVHSQQEEGGKQHVQ